MKRTAVIMAGGRGERFWPKSRLSHPKQFLSITGDGETMLQKTVRRLSGVVAIEDVFVVTNERYVSLVAQQLPDLPPENILAEPCARGTAACIGFAAGVIRKKYGDAVMFVLPSDHLIRSAELYRDALATAAETALSGDNLVTIGIVPTYPETGYGYIHFDRESAAGKPGVYRVARFVEKPDYATAREYFSSGEYLWNSGMFVWRARVILENIHTYMPELFPHLLPIQDAFGTENFPRVLAKEYTKMESDSIDFGVMEHAEAIYTIPGSFGWDDVGSWRALERLGPLDENGNYCDGDVVTYDTERTIICGENRLIACVGVENLVIVDTEDALLICAKDSAQDVRQVTRKLQADGREDKL